MDENSPTNFHGTVDAKNFATKFLETIFDNLKNIMLAAHTSNISKWVKLKTTNDIP